MNDMRCELMHSYSIAIMKHHASEYEGKLTIFVSDLFLTPIVLLYCVLLGLNTKYWNIGPLQSKLSGKVDCTSLPFDVQAHVRL